MDQAVISQPQFVVPTPLAADDELPPLRKKLPAYGKVLLQARRSGEHPEAINVVFGERWRDVPWPKVAVMPAQYRPGAIDWRVVAGVRAVVFDLAAGLADFDIAGNRYGPLFSLIAELVAVGAYVSVRYPERGAWVEQDADTLAFACRLGRQWPCWWSDDLDARQRAAFEGWLSDQERRLQRNQERGPEK